MLCSPVRLAAIAWSVPASAAKPQDPTWTSSGASRPLRPLIVVALGTNNNPDSFDQSFSHLTGGATPLLRQHCTCRNSPIEAGALSNQYFYPTAADQANIRIGEIAKRNGAPLLISGLDDRRGHDGWYCPSFPGRLSSWLSAITGGWRIAVKSASQKRALLCRLASPPGLPHRGQSNAGCVAHAETLPCLWVFKKRPRWGWCSGAVPSR